MTAIDDIDKAILNRIQSDFPITPRPYRQIAKELGLAEPDVIARVSRLKGNNIIRRIGGNFSPEKLGFVSTLCAGHVPGNKLDAFADTINRLPGVTHNYLRDDAAYNVWFTIIAPSTDQISRHITEISRETGITGILNLPATKVFKIRAHFHLTTDSNP